MTKQRGGWERALTGPGAGDTPVRAPAVLPQRPARPAAPHVIRRDIQGLRTVAVVAVVVNHLTGHPRGGFVGVDVFFVISGYLITGLLTRELERTGRISIRGFYARRVRRLFPAAWLVTALTIGASFLVFGHARAVDTAHDGFWATVFLQNWHLVSANTDYFSQGLPPSPLQHYWSLSVEEQFYVVWPLVLLVSALPILLVARRRAPASQGVRTISLVLAALIFAGSLGWAFHERARPTVAYFSTFTRAWELALGAICVFIAPRMRGGRMLLTAQSWTGIGLIVISLFVARGDANFPAPDALLPCLGAAMVILAVTPRREAVNPLLTNPVSVYIGNLSYSVYLVHYPIIILLGAQVHARGTAFYTVAVLLTVGASVMLHAGVERPVLESRWLQSKKGAAGGNPEAATTPRVLGQTVLVGSAIAVIAVAVYTLRPDSGGLSNAVQNELFNRSATQAPRGTTVSPAQARLSGAIDQALNSDTWPSQVVSSIDVATMHTSAAATAPRFSACGALPLSPRDACTFGKRRAKHLMYLVGDSTSLGYAQAMLAALDTIGDWRVRVAGTPGCPFTDRDLIPQLITPTQCRDHNRAAIAEIRSVKPDVVVITSEPNKRKDAATDAVLSESEWSDTITSTIRQVSTGPTKVVLLTAPPSDATHDVRTCYTPSSSPGDCAFRISNGFRRRMVTEQDAARATGATYLDSMPWFCDVSVDLCPAFVGDTLTHADGVHMAAAYSPLLTPVLTAMLRADKIVG